ncbi:hypothetical protein Tco_1516480, partial [Tanacetum coccineum]
STLRGQGNLGIKVRTSGGDVERLWSDKDGLWCKVEVCGGVCGGDLVAATLRTKGGDVAYFLANKWFPGEKQRPKIDDKDSFELKGQFLKELRDNTFSGSDHEDANEHIEKVLEIVDLFHIPNITQVQVMLRSFPMSLTGAASRWLRNKPFGSIITWEDLKTKFLSKYCPPARTAKKMEEINNFQ